MGFIPSPATEDLASFLQGLAPGSHVAVNLGGMDMDTAMQISRKIADTRKENFVAIGHRGQDEKLVATSLGRALPLDGLASGHQATWVVVEAAASVNAGGAKEHARAEQDVGVEVSEKSGGMLLHRGRHQASDHGQGLRSAQRRCDARAGVI